MDLFNFFFFHDLLTGLIAIFKEKFFQQCCPYWLLTFKVFSNEKSLTLRDTCKEYQNPSKTKINLVGFNHGAEVKQSSYSGYILHKRIKQSDWQREFCGQNCETPLNNWIYFYECLRICRKTVS